MKSWLQKIGNERVACVGKGRCFEIEQKIQLTCDVHFSLDAAK